MTRTAPRSPALAAAPPQRAVPVPDHLWFQSITTAPASESPRALSTRLVELEVPRIIICGHSDCGAIKAILHPEKLGRIPAVSRWLSFGRDALALLDNEFKQTSDAERITRLTKLNVLSQMKHLETHPSVIERLRCNDLTIQGWVYEIHTGRVEAFNAQTGEFEIWPD
jgi:carbonic anhydrase